MVFPLGRLVLRQTTGHLATDALLQLKTHCVMKALPVLEPKAAAIDVGSETLHVSLAGDTPHVFGTFTGELERLRDWFQAQGVRSVALEATGVYWLYVYEVLEAAGQEVVVVNGRHVQNVALAPAKPAGKNAPLIERLQELVVRLCGGRDATQIPGFSVYLVVQLISEVGTKMARWPTQKHFVSWLGVAGGREQSGKRKGSVKAHRNRPGRLFSAAARALAQSVDKALDGFYRRLRGRLGGLTANVALARKLALLFYRLLRYGMAYVEKGLKSLNPFSANGVVGKVSKPQ